MDLLGLWSWMSNVDTPGFGFGAGSGSVGDDQGGGGGERDSTDESIESDIVDLNPCSRACGENSPVPSPVPQTIFIG